MQKNIAASAQKVFERKLLEICNEIKDMNISKNLVYAGGCALNSLANKKIYDSKFLKISLFHMHQEMGADQLDLH